MTNTCTCGHAKRDHRTICMRGGAHRCPCTQYQARETAPDTIAALQSRIAELETANARLMHEKRDVMLKNKILRTRPDLPAERCDFYEKVTTRITELEAQQQATIRTFHAIEQALGRALHYPRYSDDPTNFPGATDDDVCVGENVPQTLAAEAAQRIATLEAELARSKECVRTLSDLIRARVDDSVDRSASIRQLQARIAELETQLQAVTRYFANESLANENTTLKQRISELEADAAFCEQILELKSTAEGHIRIFYASGTTLRLMTKPTFREAVTAARAESEAQ